MMLRYILLIPWLLLVLLTGCDRADKVGSEEDSSIPVGIERFLLFPNPIAQTGGGYETSNTTYAEAYYRAIDPTNQKDTLEKWKTANSFGSGTGTEHMVVFRDVKDLGYGRRMTGRRNTDGSVAFVVENYNVTDPSSSYSSGYSTFNVEAAITPDSRWHIGTNAIEWSVSSCTGEDPADCNNTIKFAKFYNFSPAGVRQLAVDLDGKGPKAMPGPCITCHGGRGDPLTPVEIGTGRPRFPLVENSLSRKRGDTQARLHGFDVDSFEFSPQPGWTRGEQEARLKDFNTWVLCSYPLPAGPSEALDSCRQAAGANEWQGTAAEMIKAWYGGTGGNGMPNAVFADNYVPSLWSGNAALYTEVVRPFCRTCHILRGTAHQSDIDFTTLAKFQGYADRIKAHVFDRGNMPLALLVYRDFWKSSAPGTLARYIDTVLGAQTATNSSNDALRPGRPIANPGPNRMVRTGASATLSAADSLFATTYDWSLISSNPPGLGAAIGNSTSSLATFFAPLAGDYTVRLTVGDGTRTNSKDVVVTVDDTFNDPSTLRFAHVKNVLQNLAATPCTSCHITPAVNPTPPIFYNNFDRNGSGGAADATDEDWFLKALTGRVNLTEIEASAILRKPTGNHHGGNNPIDLGTSLGRRNYSILYNWILAGMPAGGVAANAGADSSETVTFSGSPLSAGIALSGSGVNATSFLWSIISGPNGPGGDAPSITNANSAAATLNVTNVGTYVVQLQVSDGVVSDVDERTITVSENAITASFTPLQGSTLVVFTPSNGDITLTSVSSGSPTTCQWTINSGPTGWRLDGSLNLSSVTKSCGTPATLNVPIASVGSTYSVTLTASNIGSDSVTHLLTISNSAPTASLASTSGSVSTAFSASASNLIVPTNTAQNGSGTAGSVSVPVVTANVSLDGSSSTTPLGSLTYSWCVSVQPDSSATFRASIAICPAQTSTGTSATTSMTVKATGVYTVQLTVDNGSATNSITKNITVSPSRGKTFTGTIAATVGAAPCSGCHIYSTPLTIYNTSSGAGVPPPWNNASTLDGATLYQRIRQRVNLVTPTSSLLLVCPHLGCGAMGAQGSFSSTAVGSDYDNFLKWIQDGAPPGE